LPACKCQISALPVLTAHKAAARRVTKIWHFRHAII